MEGGAPVPDFFSTVGKTATAVAVVGILTVADVEDAAVGVEEGSWAGIDVYVGVGVEGEGAGGGIDWGRVVEVDGRESSEGSTEDGR